jgi:predicted  nucleic acid-binding Zn-ribbon protein
VLEQLELLLSLQTIDTELSDRLAEAESIPARIAELEGRKEQMDAEVDRGKHELEKAAKERQRLERELEHMAAKLSDLRSRELSIKTNEEYAALQHEIEFMKSGISETEDETLQLLEDIERLTNELAESRSAADGQRAEVDKKIEELASELARLDEAVAIKRDERARIAMRVDRAILTRYERIIASKGDVAVAPIIDGACGGCYVKLPPQRIIEVRRSNEFVECEGCGRILYWKTEASVG